MLHRFEIECDGQLFFAKAEKIGSQAWVHFQGEVFCFELRPKRSSSDEESLEHPQITAQITGKILTVAVKEGEIVTKGSLLLTMEAMKMEYSFFAESEAEVQKVKASPGQTVKEGEVLVQLAHSKP